MKRRKTRSIARDGRPWLFQAMSMLLLLTAAVLLSGCSGWNDMWGNSSSQSQPQVSEGVNSAPGTAGDTESTSRPRQSGTNY